jgi:hypothetical protein
MDIVEHGRYPGRSDMFDVKWYDKAVDTPSGHFSEPDGSFKAPPESLKATAAKNSYSRVNMDHYNTAIGAEVMLAEQVRNSDAAVPLSPSSRRTRRYEVPDVVIEIACCFFHRSHSCLSMGLRDRPTLGEDVHTHRPTISAAARKAEVAERVFAPPGAHWRQSGGGGAPQGSPELPRGSGPYAPPCAQGHHRRRPVARVQGQRLRAGAGRSQPQPPVSCAAPDWRSQGIFTSPHPVCDMARQHCLRDRRAANDTVDTHNTQPPVYNDNLDSVSNPVTCAAHASCQSTSHAAAALSIERCWSEVSRAERRAARTG